MPSMGPPASAGTGAAVAKSATPAPSSAPAARNATPVAGRGRGGAGARTGAALSSAASSISDNGGGFVLALLFWGWVGLPFLRGGPGEVRNTLRAKFFNKGPKGEWLP